MQKYSILHAKVREKYFFFSRAFVRGKGRKSAHNLILIIARQVVNGIGGLTTSHNYLVYKQYMKHLLMFVLPFITQLTLVLNIVHAVDKHNSEVVNTLAFGSCHKIKSVKKYDSTLIWNGIKSINPDTFLWLGKNFHLTLMIVQQMKKPKSHSQFYVFIRMCF